jgi:hypothetical protein
MKPRHRAGKNGVYAAVVHPPPPDAVNARVVNFNKTFAILVDRKLLPLAAQIQHCQNVVEYLLKAQFRCGTAAAGGEMRQDKLLKLYEPQLRRNRLPALSRPFGSSRKLDLTRFADVGGKARTGAAYSRIRPPPETRNQLIVSHPSSISECSRG